MANRAELYRAALAADEAFSKACVEAGFKSRWDAPSRHKMPAALASAYDAKVAADRAALEAMKGGAS
jgi:hypothetical protein